MGRSAIHMWIVRYVMVASSRNGEEEESVGLKGSSKADNDDVWQTSEGAVLQRACPAKG